MAQLPTLYEHYTAGGITAGLSASADPNFFTLNNKNVTLYSGALHYFRVPQQYWRDRLKKMRAAGLNAVETYVPWNLHEPQPGTYDFGQGGTDFQQFLDIEKFLKTAQEEDLLAIVRPGPYICSEWEFGGMPSWLLREKDMKLRTSDRLFMTHVERYFKVLLSMLSYLQFTKGGPIVAFQIENEYGNTKNGNEPVDTAYLVELKNLMVNNGIVELLFTSDTPSNGFSGALPGVLYTANFQNEPEKELKALKQFQPDKPLIVMEFWTGWFDHWTEKHHAVPYESTSAVLEKILAFPSSVNFYMFHGGTNWGFMNGANVLDTSTDNFGYTPDTSSYDYDAPLSEAGDYTDKYHSIKHIIEENNERLIKANRSVRLRSPEMPELQPRVAYPPVQITEYMDMKTAIESAPHHIHSDVPVSMEDLPINNNTGQQYGYIVYRKRNVNIGENSTIVFKGRVCDTAMVLINGRLETRAVDSKKDFEASPHWRVKDFTLDLKDRYDNATVEIVVENFGRNNYGKLNQFDQRKGLWQGPVELNGAALKDWEIVPLEFKKKWTYGLSKWKKFDRNAATDVTGPGLYRAVLNVDSAHDTFLDTRGWKKGIVIVNGFVLSRYFKLGPQQTAYLPAPLLRAGRNDIVFFEHFKPAPDVKFSPFPVFETLD